MAQCNVDQVAGALAQLGALGRHSPPAWDGDRLTSLACGPDGQFFGRVLPGRGLALAHDLWSLGITRPIPHVYERSQLHRLVERFAQVGIQCPERAAVAAYHWLPLSPTVQAARRLAAAITTYDSIITGRAGGKANDISYTKTSYTTVAAVWSCAYTAGGLPSAGSYTTIPGGAVHTRATAGALSQGLSNPTNPDKKYLLTMGFGSTQAINFLMLIDLLVAAGVISHANAANTVNTVAQTRQYGSTLGAGVMAMFDVTGALGATAGTMQLASYTNQAGTAAQASAAITCTNSAIVQRLEPSGAGSIPPFFPLVAGDYGVRSVETATSAGNTGGGTSALLLFFPLAWIPGVGSNIYVERDSTIQIDGLTELVQDGSNIIGCLALLMQTNSTSSGTLGGFLRTVAG